MSGRQHRPIFLQDDDDSVSSKSSAESETDESRHYEVERILSEQVDKADGLTRYLIKWVGYPLYHATWEPACKFDSLEILEEWDKHKKLIEQGLELEFDIEQWKDSVSNHEHHKNERRARREAKRERNRAQVLASFQANMQPEKVDVDEGEMVNVPRATPEVTNRTSSNQSGQRQVRAKKGIARPVKRNRRVPTCSSEGSDDEVGETIITDSARDSVVMPEPLNPKEKNRLSETGQGRSDSRTTFKTKDSTQEKNPDVTPLPPTTTTAVRTGPIETSSPMSKANLKVGVDPPEPATRRPSAPSVMANWEADKTRKRRPLVNDRNPSIDSTQHMRYSNLAIQNNHQKYSRREPVPDPNSLIMVDPKTGRTEPPSTSKSPQIPDVYRRSPPRPRQRSPSPSGKQSNSTAQSTDNENLAAKKAKVCKYWMNGNCMHKAEQCQYAHHYVDNSLPPNQLATKAFTCKFWRRGHCIKPAELCEFAHYETGPNIDGTGPIPDSKRKTCFFWRTNGHCGKSDAECPFAHFDTGIIANPPRTHTSYNNAQRFSSPNMTLNSRRPILSIQTNEKSITGRSSPKPLVASPASITYSADTPITTPSNVTDIAAQPSVGQQGGRMTTYRNGKIHVQLKGGKPWEFGVKFQTTDPTAFTNIAGASPSFIVKAMILVADAQKFVIDNASSNPRLSGNIVFDTSSEPDSTRLAMTCQMNSCGLIAATDGNSAKLMIFPTNTEQKRIAEPDSVPEAKFRFHLLSHFPGTLDVSTGISPIPQKLAGQSVLNLAKMLEALNFNRFFYNDKKESDRPVFLMIPPECRDELYVYTDLFHILGCKVYSAEKPGSWDYFRRHHYKSCLVIVHPDVRLDNIPHLHKFITSGGSGIGIFSLGINKMYAMLEDSEPGYDCWRLFPHGSVFFITDEVFLQRPEEATHLIRTYVKMHEKKPEGGELDRIAARPGVKEWILGLVQRRGGFYDRRDDRWIKLYDAICQLCPPEQEDPYDLPNPLPNSNLISVAPDTMPHFQELFHKQHEGELEATSYMINWFAGWALSHVIEFRKFIVCHAPKPSEVPAAEMVVDEHGRMHHEETRMECDPMGWATRYQHVGVLSPEDCTNMLKRKEISKMN